MTVIFEDSLSGGAGPLSSHISDSGQGWVESPIWGDIAPLELNGSGTLFVAGYPSESEGTANPNITVPQNFSVLLTMSENSPPVAFGSSAIVIVETNDPSYYYMFYITNGYPNADEVDCGLYIYSPLGNSSEFAVVAVTAGNPTFRLQLVGGTMNIYYGESVVCTLSDTQMVRNGVVNFKLLSNVEGHGVTEIVIDDDDEEDTDPFAEISFTNSTFINGMTLNGSGDTSITLGSVFPGLAGLTFNVSKAPMFSTKIQRSVNLNELRAQIAQFPIYEFRLGYDLLRNGVGYEELQELMGFFLSMKGSSNAFYYQDPDDYQTENQFIGTGDGSTTSFQLVRSYGGFTEWVGNTVNFIVTNSSDYEYLSSDFVSCVDGLLTFVNPPANGLNLYWSGTYYFRCRFFEDTMNFTEFMNRLWESKRVNFIGSLWNKI
jgi:uncharacterized protein (TIGR02217 family)